MFLYKYVFSLPSTPYVPDKPKILQNLIPIPSLPSHPPGPTTSHPLLVTALKNPFRHSSSSNNRTMDSNSEAGTTPLDHHVATGLPLLPPAATGAAAGMAPYSPPPPSHTPTSSPAPPPTQSQTHSHMLSHQQQRHHEFQEQQHNHQQQQLLHRLSGCGSRGKVSMHNNSLPE